MEIVLTQTSGKLPGADPVNDKQLTVKLKKPFELANYQRYMYFWGKMASENFGYWGNYVITDNWGNPYAGIGHAQASSFIKFWAFSVSDRKIYFGTYVVDRKDPTGAPVPDGIVRELSLNNTLFDAKNLSPSPIGNAPYTGSVIKNSNTGPFQTGKLLYWDTI
jgi:hypothetical protein